MSQWLSQTRKMNNHYQSGRRSGMLEKFPYFFGIIRNGKIYLTPYDLFEEGSTHGTYSYWLGQDGGYYKSIKFGDIIKKTPLFSGKFDIEGSKGDTKGIIKQSFSVFDIGEITPKYQTIELSTNDAYTIEYYTGKMSNNKVITDGVRKALTIAEGEKDVGGIIVPTYHSYYTCHTQTFSTEDSPQNIPDFAKDFPNIKLTDTQKFTIGGTLIYQSAMPYNLDLLGIIAPSILNTRNKFFENTDEFMFWENAHNNAGYITGVHKWGNYSFVENLEDSFNVWGFGYRVAGEDAEEQLPILNFWAFPSMCSIYTEDGKSFDWDDPNNLGRHVNANFSNTTMKATPGDYPPASQDIGGGYVVVTEGNTTYGFGRMCILTGLTFIDNFERAVRNIE